VLLAGAGGWHLSAKVVEGAVPLATFPEGGDLVGELRESVSAVAHTWMRAYPATELAWSWGEGVLAFGLEQAYQATGDPALRDYLRAYLRAHSARGVEVTWSDRATPGLVAIERCLDGDVEFAPLAAQAVRYIMSGPRSASGMLLHLGHAYPKLVRAVFPEVWVDSLFHVVPTLMRYSRWTSEPRYRDEGARQLVLFLRALTDPRSGLVAHAFNDAPRAEPVPPFESGAFWARGNGWALATLVDALGWLPAQHSSRAELIEMTRRLAARLCALQAESGLFHTLLLEPESYRETAGSGLILFGVARGLRLRLLPLTARAVLERGGKGLWSIVRRSGSEAVVTGTSLGTNPIESLYRRIPTSDQISYGVGAWLLAATELTNVLAGSHAAIGEREVEPGGRVPPCTARTG